MEYIAAIIIVVVYYTYKTLLILSIPLHLIIRMFGRKGFITYDKYFGYELEIRNPFRINSDPKWFDKF